MIGQDISFKEALEFSNKEINKNKNDGTAYANRAGVYMQNGEYEKAINDYSKAIELGIDFIGNIYFSRGYARYFIGKYLEARDDYKRGLDLEPDFENAKELIEEVEFKIKAKAYDYWERGKDELPKGIFKKKGGNLDLVIEYWEKSLQYDIINENIKIDLSNLYFNRGIENYKNKSIEMAISDFEHSFKHNPKNKVAINNVIGIYIDCGVEYLKNAQSKYEAKDYDNTIADATNAINYYEKAVCLKEYSSQINDDFNYSFSYCFTVRSLAYYANQNYRMMISDLLKAKEIYSDHPDFLNNIFVAYYKLAIECYENKEYSEAVEFTKEALKYKPDDKDSIKNLEIFNAALK